MPSPPRKLPLLPIACGCVMLGPLSIFAADSLFNALKPKTPSAAAEASALSGGLGLLGSGVGSLSDLSTIAPSLEMFAPSGGLPFGGSDVEAKELAALEKLRAGARARVPKEPLSESPVLLTLPPKGADSASPSATGSPVPTTSSTTSGPLKDTYASTWVILSQLNSERRRVFSELPAEDPVAGLAAIRGYLDFKIAKFEELARLHDGFVRKFVDALVVHNREQKVVQLAFLEAQIEWLNVLTYERKPTRDELATRIEIAEALVAATQEYHTWLENLPVLRDRLESEEPDAQTEELLRKVVASFEAENEAQLPLLNGNYDIAQTSVRMLKFLRTNYNDWTVVGTLPTFDDGKLKSQFDDLMATLENHLDVVAELEETALRRAKSQ
jgi:preprotein translocase subunit Sss1